MEVPKTFGHYQVKSELGRGGMAVVYKCWEPSLNRFVAVKVLSEHLAQDYELKQRFLREARSMAAINHPNVIKVHFIGEQNEQPYFAMEFIQGSSLSDLLQSDWKLNFKHAKSILYQVCDGLLAAHKQGLIHRDIKPGNLMIADDGILKIVDFGIAQSQNFEKRLTSTGELVGTPGYLAPEVCIGQSIDIRADIFALGIVLYEMLAGRVPFKNDSPLGLLLDVVESNITDIRLHNKSVDIKTAQILTKMLERNPDERFQDCQQIMNLLEKPHSNFTIQIIKQGREKVELSGDNLSNNNITLVNKLEKAQPANKTSWPWLNLILVFSLLSAVVVFFLYYTDFNEVNKPEIEKNITTTPNFYSTSDNSQIVAEEFKEIETNTNQEVDSIGDDNENNLSLNSINIPTISTSDSVDESKQQVHVTANNCIEVATFKILNSRSKKKTLTKTFLKKLRHQTIGEIKKDKNTFASGNYKCMKTRNSFRLLVEFKQNTVTKFLTSQGPEKGKVYITLTLINKYTNHRIAQKRIIENDLFMQLETIKQTNKFPFAQKVNDFIGSAL